MKNQPIATIRAMAEKIWLNATSHGTEEPYASQAKAILATLKELEGEPITAHMELSDEEIEAKWSGRLTPRFSKPAFSPSVTNAAPPIKPRDRFAPVEYLESPDGKIRKVRPGASRVSEILKEMGFTPTDKRPEPKPRPSKKKGYYYTDHAFRGGY